MYCLILVLVGALIVRPFPRQPAYFCVRHIVFLLQIHLIPAHTTTEWLLEQSMRETIAAESVIRAERDEAVNGWNEEPEKTSAYQLDIPPSDHRATRSSSPASPPPEESSQISDKIHHTDHEPPDTPQVHGESTHPTLNMLSFLHPHNPHLPTFFSYIKSIRHHP